MHIASAQSKLMFVAEMEETLITPAQSKLMFVAET
jgi:hypothetical protein